MFYFSFTYVISFIKEPSKSTMLLIKIDTAFSILWDKTFLFLSYLITLFRLEQTGCFLLCNTLLHMKNPYQNRISTAIIYLMNMKTLYIFLSTGNALDASAGLESCITEPDPHINNSPLGDCLLWIY